MTTADLHDPAARADQRFRYRLARGDLAFQTYETADPLPVGLQILAAAALRPPEAFSLVAILPSGDFEEIRLNEPYDLRGQGAEKLIAFETDRLYRLSLVSAQVLWGARTIPEAVLRELAGAAADQALFLDVPGGADELIPEGGVLDLDRPGVERVVVAPKPKPGFEIVVIYNGQPKPLRVKRQDLIQNVLDAARAAFGHPPGDLELFNEAGAQLEPGQTVHAAGVQPNSRLLLRPRIVQGG